MQANQAAVSPEEVMDVSGKAGQPIALPIADGPPTGYSWQLDLPQQVSQAGNVPGRPVTPDYHLGASTTGPLQLLAPAGEYTVHARLSRPWAPDRPIRTITIHLHVS